MYSRRLIQFIIPEKFNLKNTFLKGGFQTRFVQKYNSFIRQKFDVLKNFQDFNNRLRDIIKSGQIFKVFSEKPISSRSPKNSVVKVWVYHCECVFAQRLRRCQQMFSLYSKWWEEKALKDFMNRMRQNIMKRGKEFTLTTVAVYNWKENRIPIKEIVVNEKEFEYINVLKDNTICLACDRTQTNDNNNNNSSICKCGTRGVPSGKTYDNWAPFIEKTDLVVWRRLHPSGSGQYEYKLFGSYKDITAEDFLNVQVDIDYRKIWDTTAVVLQQGESDPDENSNSDIIYWEMLWPRLFVNRDYVFNRRYVVDKAKKLIYIVSKSTEHPSFPKFADKFRIEDYWSCMVIRPYDDLSQPGIEFVLTYYDNPGVNIPSSVTTWVAMRAMPDFLEKLREAAKAYRAYCQSEGSSKFCKILLKNVKYSGDQNEREKLDYCTIGREVRNFLNQHSKGEYKRKENSPGNNKDVDISNTDTNTTKSTSLFKYLHPMYYFQ